MQAEWILTAMVWVAQDAEIAQHPLATRRVSEKEIQAVLDRAPGTEVAGRARRFKKELESSGAAPESVALREFPVDAERALSTMRRSLRELGVSAEESSFLLEQEAEQIPGTAFNVVAEIPGKTGRRIVLMAHLDASSAGEGIIDNWSGCVALVVLYRALHASEPEHTLVFAGVGGQELGFLGARDLIDSMGDEIEAVDAVINLDCLGITEPAAWSAGTTIGLLHVLREVGEEIGRPISTRSFANLDERSSDLDPFTRQGVPSLYLDGMDPAQSGLLRLGLDRRGVIRVEHLAETVQVVLACLQRLDGIGERLTRQYLTEKLGVSGETLRELSLFETVRLAASPDAAPAAEDKSEMTDKTDKQDN